MPSGLDAGGRLLDSISTALNLGLSATLISLIGLDGAAIGTATGLACANLLMAWRRVAAWSAARHGELCSTLAPPDGCANPQHSAS